MGTYPRSGLPAPELYNSASIVSIVVPSQKFDTERRYKIGRKTGKGYNTKHTFV